MEICFWILVVMLGIEPQMLYMLDRSSIPEWYVLLTLARQIKRSVISYHVD